MLVFADGQFVVLCDAKVMGKEAKDFNGDGKVKYRLKLGFIGGLRTVGLPDKAAFERAPAQGEECDVAGVYNEMKDQKGTTVFLSDVEFYPPGTLALLLSRANLAKASAQAQGGASSGEPVRRAA